VLLLAYTLLTMILHVEYCGMSLVRFFCEHEAYDASTHGGGIVLNTPRDSRKDNDDDISNNLSCG
jgi:hypothetical protein